MQVKISILIPCFNSAKYIDQCLHSVCGQTYHNIEIICINDGSTDETSKILHEYSKRDSRIRIISKPNSGYGHSMNIGLNLATGDYIGIVEPDDYIEKKMFEKLITLAIEYNLDIVKGRFFHFNTIENSNKIVNISNITNNQVINPIEDQNVFYLPPSIWSAIYKRDFLIKHQINFLETPGASYQDTSFSFKSLLCANRIMIINEPLVHYRIDNPNSTVNNPTKIFCVCDEFTEIWKFAKRCPDKYDLIKNTIPILQFRAYKWNYNRLQQTLKKDFLKKFRQDFLILKQTNKIDWSKFRSHDKKILFSLYYLPFLLSLRSRI